MRSFYIIICLFALMLVGVTINHVYTRNLTADMIDVLEQIPLPSKSDSAWKHAEQTQQTWQKHRRWIHITVSHTKVEDIDSAIDELCVFARHKNDGEFDRARTLIIHSLEELVQTEKLSFINIL